jgi:hypothetical protein
MPAGAPRCPPHGMTRTPTCVRSARPLRSGRRSCGGSSGLRPLPFARPCVLTVFQALRPATSHGQRRQRDPSGPACSDLRYRHSQRRAFRRIRLKSLTSLPSPRTSSVRRSGSAYRVRSHSPYVSLRSDAPRGRGEMVDAADSKRAHGSGPDAGRCASH